MSKHALAKIIAWSVITIAFSVIFFAVLEQAFVTPLVNGRAIITFLGRIVLPIIVFSAFFAALGILAMFPQPKIIRPLVSLLCGIGVFLFFDFSVWSLIAFVAFVVSCFLYHLSVTGDVASRIRVQPYFTLVSGLGTLIVIIIASVSLLYYSTFSTNPDALQTVRVSLRNSIVDGAIAIASTRVPNFSGDITVDEFIGNVLVGNISFDVIPQFETTAVPENVDQEKINALRKSLNEAKAIPLPGENKSDELGEIIRFDISKLPDVEKELIRQLRTDVFATVGISGDEQTTIREALTQIVEKNVLQKIESYTSYLPLIFSVSLFVLLYTFSFLYRYLTRAFGMIFYGLLRWVRFFAITTRTVEAQRISLEE